jgi:uncharacterized protein
MKTREFNPLRLDVAKLAHKQTEISGEHKHASLERLMQIEVAAPDLTERPVTWSARAEERPVRGGKPQIWMHLSVQTSVGVQCQRCLDTTTIAIDLDHSFRFVADEATAASLDAELDDADVLVADGALNLLGLIEDEILLALPIVPMHEVCPSPVIVDHGVALPSGELVASTHLSSDGGPLAASGGDSGEHAEHPFAALAALKRRSSTS